MKRSCFWSVAALVAIASGCSSTEPVDSASESSQAITANGADVTLTFSSDWGGGYCSDVKITNKGSAAIKGWTVIVSLGGSTFGNGWSATTSVGNGNLTVTPAGYNATIAVGQSVSFGFCGNSTTNTQRPTLVSATIQGGGSAAAGGASSTGGTTAKGGTKATGGTTAKGGTKATGGTTAKGGSSATGGTTAKGGTKATGGTTAATTPPSGTVRVFYLRPTDVPFDQKIPDGIGNVMLETQAFYKQQLGKTFKLNTPIVEVLVGERVRSWYETTPTGSYDKYWWSAMNAQQEIQRRFKLPDNRWMGVSEVSAEGTGAGGGASGGWVLLCGHDADGAAGYPANKARWVGGMVHEMGHAFGLPDSTSTDGTCMSASFYSWPNCTFTQRQKDRMLNGAWGSGKFLF